MKRFGIGAAALLAGGSVASPLIAADGTDVSTRPAPLEIVQLKDARLKFEINATDEDGGVQVFIDADDWRTMSIFDPNGNRIFKSDAMGRLGKHGGTELFLESGEPPFSELPLEKLLRRWPEGEYDFLGRGTDGEILIGSTELTHHLPDGPELVSPIESDGLQDPADTVMRWRGVASPDGSPIIGYQVLVVDPASGLRALPKVTLDVTMPSTARRLRVPRGFLQRDTEYEWEVLAIEASGNQTLSSSTFATE
jgi:hypothetical protein